VDIGLASFLNFLRSPDNRAVPEQPASMISELLKFRHDPKIFRSCVMHDRMQTFARYELNQIHDASIDVETIKSIGAGGHYLLHPTTFSQFRSLSQPRLVNRRDYQKWWANGAKSIDQSAAEALADRMAAYSKPPIDQGLEQALTEYVNRRKVEAKLHSTDLPLKKVA
jgi:trimethylamine:corrinoid methyltransferase-like protein